MGPSSTARLWRVVGLALAGALGLTGCPPTAEVEDQRAGLQVAEAPMHGWPALPGSAVELDALLERNERRPGSEGPPLAVQHAEALVELLEAGPRRARGVVGWAGIASWLRGRLEAASRAKRRLFVLWGVHHDSAGQLAAFRRLALDSARVPFDLVVVEQFDADGRWADLPRDLQRGDDQDLTDFLAQGHQPAWQRLARKQRRDNFTARHFGYLEQVLGLVATARQRKRRLCGCDMNATLQQRASNRLEDLGSTHRAEGLLRLRELHCWLTLQHQLGGTPAPRQIAMLWGQSHLAPQAFPLFVPPADEVIAIYLLGQRLGFHGSAKTLPKRLRSAEPLLLPLDVGGHQAVLLLPELPPLLPELPPS